MSDSLVNICTLTTQAEADLVESVLRAAGIPMVHDHEFATTAGIGDVSGINIKVREEDAERARELLDTPGAITSETPLDEYEEEAESAE